MSRPVFGRVVVVGASLAGLRAVEALRRCGYAGRLGLLGEELEAPYERAPLPRAVLSGGLAAGGSSFRDRRHFEELGVELMLGVRATGLDTAARVVSTTSADEPYDGLIIATGCRARAVPFLTSSLGGVHVLRTGQDAARLQRQLSSASRVVVIGAGLLNGEVASAARALGGRVTMLEAGSAPLTGLGPPLAESYVRLHRNHEVDLRCGVEVVGFRGTDTVEGVELADGTVLPADLVVVGVATVPATEWLVGSGLRLDNGVVCDATLWTGAPDVYAAGNVVRWRHPVYDRHIRVEHWTTAAEQAAAAARNLLAGQARRRPYTGLPYFWSDQHGARVQFAGDAESVDEIVHIDSGDGRELFLYRRDADLVAVAAVDCVHEFVKYRAHLSHSASWRDADHEIQNLSPDLAASKVSICDPGRTRSYLHAS